jgi:hypothetical protein
MIKNRNHQFQKYYENSITSRLNEVLLSPKLGVQLLMILDMTTMKERDHVTHDHDRSC